MKQLVVGIAVCACFLAASMQREFSPTEIDQAVNDLRALGCFEILPHFQRGLSEGDLRVLVTSESAKDPEFVKKADILGNTWLHYAARHKMPNLIAAIAVLGGVHTRNNDGITPLMYALHNNTQYVEYDRFNYRATIVQLLIRWHSHDDLLHLGGMPVLDMMVGQGHMLAVHAMMNAGYAEYWRAVSSAPLLAGIATLHIDGRTTRARAMRRCREFVMNYRHDVT